MATFLAVPLKRTWEVDLQKKLKTFISSTFDKIDPEDYNKALQEFNKLRNNVISKSVDRHESSLEVLYRYFDQLEAIEGKLPIAENQIRIDFKWQDAFDKESFFSGRRVLAIASGAYEKVCTLFNIAALQSQIAANQSAESDEGLKVAAKYFQQACGIFRHLKDIVLSHVQNDPTPDMQPDTLGALSSLMLAQAQDCICRKAITGKMKPAIVVKLCHQASDLYADAMKLLQLQSIRDLWPKDWIASVAGKQAAYHALAEYFQSEVAKDDREFGEEIARLRHAKDLMTAAETRGGQAFIFQQWSGRINRALEAANKDNDVIYHARIPDLSSLPALGKHSVAKATDFSAPLSSNFQDLFDKVVPLAVHSALQVFEARKGEIVNMEIGRLREATQLMNSILASLNLPAAIEDLSGNKAPASVMEKGAKMKELGGSTYLTQLMTELPALLTRNKEILEESVRMLDEEEASDKQLRQQFNERWTRTPSDKLTAPIRGESMKYKAILDNAIQADHVVKERFGKSREGIEILSKPDAEIESSLPPASPVAALQGSPVVAELRQLMDQVDTIKAERDVIENEIKEAKCDMSSKFMTALAQDGAIDEQALATTELDRIYSPLREQVSDSVHRQEALLNKIQQSNNQFVQAKSQNQAGMSREEKLKELASAFDSFVELKNNLEEGTKFYNDLTQLLVKFQSKVNDLCFARKTEKEELMRDLNNSIARQPSSAPPSAPAYQQPTEAPSSESAETPRQPPARPPPPTRPPAPVQAQQPPAQAPPQQPQQPYGMGYPVSQPAGYPQPTPYPGAYGAAPAATPYPVYPPGGYAPPPMPQGYNPYAQYSYPQQAQPYPAQQYPGYPGYPQQQWR